jgi:hypothetical protein
MQLSADKVPPDIRLTNEKIIARQLWLKFPGKLGSMERIAARWGRGNLKKRS